MLRRQEAYDKHHNNIDLLTSGKSKHGPFMLNCYVDNSRGECSRGEHYHLYHVANHDGQHTSPPDIIDNSALPLIKGVVKDVIERYLAYDGLDEVEEEYDLKSANLFRNHVAKDIYEVYGNAAQTSVGLGRGAGGGQLPMTADSVYRFTCVVYNVVWCDRASSWIRVTNEWPHAGEMRVGVIGPGYGEEWLLIAKAVAEIRRQYPDAPRLRVIGFEIDEAVAKKCHKNIHALGVQEDVRCFVADWFAVGAIAEFGTSLVAEFNLGFLYTTAAVGPEFALHVYTYGILHRLVVITDERSSQHFVEAYNQLFPYPGRAGNRGVNRLPSMPVKMCDARVGGAGSGGDEVSSLRPIWKLDCREREEGEFSAADRAKTVKLLASQVKKRTLATWTRSKGGHTTGGFCQWLNRTMEPHRYKEGEESFLFTYYATTTSPL